MQEFFEQALSQSPNGNLLEYVRPVLCFKTLCLTLEGVAGSYYQKQIAQEACLPLVAEYEGVTLVNNIQVIKP